MHTRQPKSHNPDTAPTKAAEPTPKAAVSAASASRVPLWAGGMNDQISSSLLLQNANTIPGIQAKLAISQPNDPYEQEADRVAEHVMRMPTAPPSVQRKCACGGVAGPTGECEACALKRKALQRRATQSATEGTAPPVVNQVLSSGNGQPLGAGTRALMEPRFGQDFSEVRVHTDGQAAESARSVNALAYTVGSDVVFGMGQYRPETAEGQKLLAHELAHTIQQSQGSAMVQRMPSGPTTSSSTVPLGGANPVPHPASIPPRGPNPATCLLPLCNAIPRTSSNPQQYADKWHTDALACLNANAPASNASHAGDIMRTFEQELQKEVDELNDYYNSFSPAERAKRHTEYLADLKTLCRRKQREIEIEFHFNVVFERSPGAPKWGRGPGEWDEIEAALEALPVEATWTNPTFLHFRREACHPNDVDPQTGQCVGRTGGETDPGTGVIRIFDAGLGRQPYSRSMNLGLSATAQTLRHEVGHVIDSQIPRDEMTNFFENIMHWHQYPGAWITPNPSPNPTWKAERDHVRAKLGFNDAQFDAWLRTLTAGTPVVQGSYTYVKHPVVPGSSDFFLLSYETSQMPTGREFEYARTNQGDYFADVYALAVSRPEFIYAKLPPAQIAWLKTVVFHTEEQYQRVAREAAVAGPVQDEFLVRARRAPVFTYNHILQILNDLLVHSRPSRSVPAFQTRLAVSQPNDPYEREADRVAEQVMSMPASPTTVQRKCACGGIAGPTGECEACAAKRQALHSGPLMLQRQPAPTAPCTVGDPGNCPTYEEWIHTFKELPTFPAADMAPAGVRGLGFRVLGDEPAREVRPGNDPAPQPDRKLPPPPATGERNYEHFIDHPTDAWVTKNLPAELRATAYLLPVDCADLAAVLRHVWLFYHKRTERYGKWVLGLGVSHADIQKLIVWDLSAYNVKKIVNMYSDAAGRPILSFEALKKLLHYGDILVWEHHKNSANGPLIGGHTQTVEHVERDKQGNATSLTLLQGNEPIFRKQAEAIKKKLGAAVPGVGTMRDAPGRRIERAELRDENLHDKGGVWTQITKTEDDNGKTMEEFTILVAAGPAASAIRPAVGKSFGTLGQLSDWLPLLRKATPGNLEATFEAALQATRAMIEGGQQAVTEQDAATLGSIVGERLRMLARLSQAGHGGGFDALKTLQRLHAVVRALGGLGLAIGSAVQVQDTTLKRIFERIDVALESVEETRLIPSLSSPFGTTSAPGQIIMGAGFSQLLIPFGAALNAASTLMAAQTVVRDFGQKLWQLATARAQAGKSPDTDDRPLYWTRLLMMHALRMWQPGFPIDFGQRQDLLDLFERASRGMESVSFSGAAGVKKILISGFDPFGLDTNINTGNPSGAVALALNGRTITRGGMKAEVRSVIFPVRFADFDEGKVETFFRPHLTGPDRVDMIMTISQGDTEFKVEEWAGRRRSSGSFADNAGRIGGGSLDAPAVPAGLGKGQEFIQTALPKEEIRAELGRTRPIAAETEFKDIPGKHTDKSQKDPTKRRSIAVEGSGGGFLSNEIFYRASLLRLQTHSSIRVGHLHVPIVGTQSGLQGASNPWTRDAIVNQVQRILEATLPKL